MPAWMVRTRRDVHELLAEFSDMDADEVGRYARDLSERSRLFPVVDTLAAYIQKCLKNHDIHLRRARIRKIQDGIAKKQRNICIASMLQQIYDYIAKIGLQELFDAKFAPHQCATIPGRGQIYGKKFNERWLREPARDHAWRESRGEKPCIALCHRGGRAQVLPVHVHRAAQEAPPARRAKPGAFVADGVPDRQDDAGTAQPAPAQADGGNAVFGRRGLAGTARSTRHIYRSYLSCNLCNYIISYAWHYLMQQAVRWEMRRGKRTRVRMVTHCDIYMDNFQIFGSNKRDLMQRGADA